MGKNKRHELNLATDGDEAPETLVLVDGDGNLVQVDSDLVDSTVRVVRSVDRDGRFQLSALNGVGGSSNLVSLNTGLHNTQLPVTNLVDLNTGFDDSRVGQNGDLVLEDFQADARTGQSYRAR